MKACHAGSSDDLTIILPRSGLCALRKSSARLSSKNCGSSPRSQGSVWNRGLHPDKTQCFVRKRRSARLKVVSTMSVLALVLATTITAAARKTAGPRLGGEERMAALVVGQAQAPHEALPTPAAQFPLLQTCSAQTTHGTAVYFVATPTEAAREARKNNKLTFLLHISGNFEGADFT
jgi:hypothetical protein